jgi:O-antigen/teichoic acid export membrane protein
MTAGSGAPTPPGSSATISAGGATGVGLASIVAAGSGYGVLVLAAHTLSTQDNADFLVFWSLLFGMYGVLGGVQNETTRASGGGPGHAQGARVVPWGLGVGALAAVALAAGASWWAPRLLGTGWQSSLWAVCGGVLAFAGHSSLAGALAGARRWASYSVLVAVEALTRLILCVGVAVTLTSPGPGLEIATAGASVAWIVLVLVSPATRSALRARADVRAGALLRNTGHAVLAAASSAALVVGFPVLLRATTDSQTFATAAPLILAISVTRAPLLMPLAAYQGVAISHFVAHRDRGLAGLRRIVAVIVGAGVGVSLIAALVGTWGMRLLFGAGYGVPGVVLAGLTLGATCLALTTVTGAVTLAIGSHAAFAGGWLGATAIALGTLLLPLPLETRTVLGLMVGPLVGAAVHAAAIQRGTARARAATG